MNLSVRAVCLFLVIGFASAIGTGCATSRGSYQLTSAPAGEAKLSRYSDLCVEVTCSQGLGLAPSDLDRMRQLIVNNVPTECSGKYKCIDPPVTGSNVILAKVNVTTYDEGNAFARWMLAGLGQMHIDAEVTLNDHATGEELLRSEVKKTFAWGGMYGATTRITDVEDGFAKAVAASFSGKK